MRLPIAHSLRANREFVARKLRESRSKQRTPATSFPLITTCAYVRNPPFVLHAVYVQNIRVPYIKTEKCLPHILAPLPQLSSDNLDLC